MAPARRLADLARTFGVHVLIGTTQELSIGTAAQAHLGASLPQLDHPGDPVGPRLYAEDVVKRRVDYDKGNLLVPVGPGLGVELDRGALERLAAPLEWGVESLPSIQDRTVPHEPPPRRRKGRAK